MSSKYIRMSDMWNDPPATRWGYWSYHSDPPELFYDGPQPGYGYTIDLMTCTTSAGVLNWIIQIEGKVWRAEGVLDLAAALNDLLHLQGTMCSSGIEGGPIDVRRVLNRNGYQAQPHKSSRAK